ncbi:hypothetical protein [Bizionia paragorgiae]|nr:hypothetical protein [Bizionia paragorgiae]MDX1272693.1 hypothetical protein [Bizionia paragorgiae]
MSTYKCTSCGTYKNDTVVSQLNTSPTCNNSKDSNAIIIHKWEKISDEDL